MGKTFAMVFAVVGCLGTVGCVGDVDDETVGDAAEPHPWAEEAGIGEELELELDERRLDLLEKDFAAPQEDGDGAPEAHPRPKRPRPMPALEAPLPAWDGVSELTDDSGPA